MIGFRKKDKIFWIFIIILLVLCAIYVYINDIKENYRSAYWSEERCSSELTSVKYQLKVVTDYKEKIDKLLMETQKTCDAEKARFRDVMETCVAMKQQTALCQIQFEDLQNECKKVKEYNEKVVKYLDKNKVLNT